jgi:hypothetical protein
MTDEKWRVAFPATTRGEVAEAANLAIGSLRRELARKYADHENAERVLAQLRIDMQAEVDALKAKADAFDRVLRIGDTEDDELPEDAISKIAEIVTDYYAAKVIRFER